MQDRKYAIVMFFTLLSLREMHKQSRIFCKNNYICSS